MVKQGDGHREEPDDDRSEALQDGQLGPQLSRFEVIDIVGETIAGHILTHEREGHQQPAQVDDAQEDRHPTHEVGSLRTHEGARDEDRGQHHQQPHRVARAVDHELVEP